MESIINRGKIGEDVKRKKGKKCPLNTTIYNVHKTEETLGASQILGGGVKYKTSSFSSG